MEKLSRVKKYHQNDKPIKKEEIENNYKKEYHYQPEEIASDKVVDIRSSISAKKELPTELLILKEIREKQNRPKTITSMETEPKEVEPEEINIVEHEQNNPVIDDNYIKREYRRRNQKIQDFYVSEDEDDEEIEEYHEKSKMDIVTKIMLGVVAVLVILIIVLIVVIFL